MARYVILGVKGDAELYLIDLDRLRVSRADAATAAAGDGEPRLIDLVFRAREKGCVVINDIDLAVVADGRSEPAFMRLSP